MFDNERKACISRVNFLDYIEGLNKNQLQMENAMNQFVSKSEEKGREIATSFLKSVGAKNIEVSDSPYSCFDLSYTRKGRIHIAEIKTREYAHDDYPKWILEKEKYDMLQDVVNVLKKAGLDPVVHYINIFKDGKIFIWDITNLEHLQSRIRNLAKVSGQDNGTRDKKVLLLSSDEVEHLIPTNEPEVKPWSMADEWGDEEF